MTLNSLKRGKPMIIYTVKQGDTLYNIAKRYSTTPDRIAADNLITEPNKLVVGQTLVILEPLVTYRVRGGDTLYSIASRFGITLNRLWRNNPILKGGSYIRPGQVLNIVLPSPEYNKTIQTNGYVYPSVSDEVLMQTLPYLTYVTVFSYGVRPDGSLIDVDDERIIEMARQYGVAPVMMVTSLGEDGTFSAETVTSILSDGEKASKLIDEIAEVLSRKRYAAVDVDFEYVSGEYADEYADFIRRLSERVNKDGYEVFVALAPKTSDDQPGLLYEGHDYEQLGSAANGVLLMTYEWGYSRGEPQAVSPINKVRPVVEYGVEEIPSGKIFLGVPNYGYDWQLPFVAGETVASSLSNVEAVDRAWSKKAEIRFDDTAMSPYYNYFEHEKGRASEHIVWFEDGRGVSAMLGLIDEFSLRGMSVWNLMKYFPQLWTVLNSQFDIKRMYE